MGKKSILVTATTFPRWENDTEPNFVFTLSRLLAEHGHKVTVLAPHYNGAKKYEAIGNVKVYRFSYFMPYKLQKVCYEGGIFANLKRHKIAALELPLFVFFELTSMIRLIKKERIDVVHAHWTIPQGYLAYICKKFLNIPYIVTAHAGDIFPLKSVFFRHLSSKAIENSDYCTANSVYTKNELLKIAEKEVKVIPMGVDFSIFSKTKLNRNLRKNIGIKKEFILTVGRLVEKKGIKYLIMAMKDVAKKLPDARLVIAGDGPERANLETLAKNLGIENSIIFAGRLENKYLPEYYAAADLFVGPSIVTESGDTEGLGIVFLEALASGTCVIGSNVGGIPDIIQNNRTGLLVKEKNPKELSNAIIKLLSNHKLRERLAQNGQKRIKQIYSWKIVAQKFSQLVEDIR